MTANVVPDCLPEFFRYGGKVLDKGIDLHGCEGFVTIQGGVEVVYISLMVLPMVNFHGPGVEVRFERIG